MAWCLLGTISSALNPIIYGVLNKNFQKEYLKMLRCGYCRSKRIVESSGGRTGQHRSSYIVGGFSAFFAKIRLNQTQLYIYFPSDGIYMMNFQMVSI